jgi:hypothetical protein
MKRVIDNKKYDTETATLAGEHWNGRDSADLDSVLERLYVTKNQAWFLHGKGGANTEYATHSGDGRWNGETIIPMTAEGALEWLHRHNEVDALENHFADRIKDA